MSQYNDDRKQNLNFTDSWLQNTVELAALGAIVSGAGAFAVKGNLGGAVNSSKSALKAAGKGFENYIKRRGGLGAKLGYGVGKKTFNRMRRMPTTKQEEMHAADTIQSFLKKNVKDIDSDPEIQQKMRAEAARRMANQSNRNIIDDALDGTNRNKRDLDDQARYLYEKVRSEEINSRLYGTPSPLSPPNRKRNDGSNNARKPFDKKQVAQEMVGSGLTGLAFGAGISGMHALDRASADLTNQEKLENKFKFGGSFMSDKDRLNKQAGALEGYNTLKSIGKKTPEAIASGLGFTGISLATANILNKKKEDKENGPAKGSRVIIELGGESDDVHGSNVESGPMGLVGLPRVAYTHSRDMQKEAAPFDSLRQFARDFRGYAPEVEKLREQNPADIAAENLKNEDVSSLLKNQYGNLVTDASEPQFRKQLFDSRTEQAKQDIEKQIHGLETRKASARLKGVGGGILATGGGLAALSAMKSPKKEESGNGSA